MSAGALFLVLRLFRYGKVFPHSPFYGVWQTILLTLFILIFRKEISNRNSAGSGTYLGWIGYRSSKRAKALLKVCLVFWFMADILRRLIIDILSVLRHGDYEYW
jgi:hypothetical protein